MTGLAFWCEKDKTVELCNKQSYSVHFNLWADGLSKNMTPLLDMGIKIPYQSCLKKLHFYLPYTINKNAISDLGSIIASDKILLNSVFNESYTCENSNNPKKHIIKQKDKEEFIIYSLDISHDIAVENKFGGSIITIDLTNKLLDQNKIYYFRLRFNDKALKDMIDKKSSNFILDTVSTENNFIDFRFNDWRSMKQ